MKIHSSPFLQCAPPKLQNIWLSQFQLWTKIFKKQGGLVAQGGRKRRLKIQKLARWHIDRTISEFNAGAATVCQKGCAHCCYFNVSVNVLEAERLAEIIREMPEHRRSQVMRRLEAANEAYLQVDQQESIYRHPCPFLEGTVCSIYEDRPLNCRSHVSTDVAFCIAELNAKTGIVSAGDPGVTPEAMRGKIEWHILLHPITAAAHNLIGDAGSMPAAVLKRMSIELRHEAPKARMNNGRAVDRQRPPANRA